MGKTALLFAGQGSQTPGMGCDLYEAFPEFRRVFDLLSEEKRRIAFEGSSEELAQTVNTQPVLLAFGVGIYRILEAHGFHYDMTAGLSLGEYSALTAADVFGDEQALSLIQYRANAMAEASEGVSTVMSAVLGLSRDTILNIVREASSKGVVEAANFNCPGQVVISGEEAAVAEAERLSKINGARRCMRLPVSGPFHTSFMKPAAEKLHERFLKESFGDMQKVVYFNCTGQPLTEGRTVAEMLEQQVMSSVFMEDTIAAMAKAGADRFIEIGPGKALSGFVKRTVRGMDVLNLNSAEDVCEFLNQEGK